MARRLKTSACSYFQMTNDRCDRNSYEGDNGNEHVFDEQKAYRAMAMFVCSEKVSPRAFLGDSFKEVLKITNPGFHVSFATLERHCLKLYKEETEKIKQVFRDFDGQVSLSMDILRHNTYDVRSYKLPQGQTVFDYMCLTVHFIDDKWKLNNRVVYFGSLYYTTEYAPEKVILKCLSDLEIENKVSAVTMLNGFEYDDMAEAVKDRVQGKKLLQINGKLFRISCCAHLFRLLVEEAFEEIEWTIRKIRRIVPFGKSLPQWHITLHILQEALELESKGEYLKQDEYGCFDIPSAEEWKQVRGVCKLVGNIYKAAEVLFETKLPTASLYLHNLQELRESLKKESTSSDRFVRDMAQHMLEEFDDKYWKNMFLVLAVATAMDPQFKMKYIEFSSLKYEGVAGSSDIKVVLETIHSIFDDYMAHHPEKDDHRSDSTSSGPESDEELPRHIVERRRDPCYEFHCLVEYNQFIQSNSLPKSELELYLEEPVLPWSKDFNLLNWWKAASAKYPTMSKIARDLLAIPLSVATSSDAYYYTDFRKANGDVVRLGPDLANALMCTRSWIKKHRRDIN